MVSRSLSKSEDEVPDNVCMSEAFSMIAKAVDCAHKSPKQVVLAVTAMVKERKGIHVAK